MNGIRLHRDASRSTFATSTPIGTDGFTLSITHTPHGPGGVERESLGTLFGIVFMLSSLSWGGLALMAQLEHHYVERKQKLTRGAFADLIALAWMVPGPVGCNVAVQLGYTLRGAAGAWVAGAASVLPFFLSMTLFAVFSHTSLIHTATSQTLLNHFNVVLATLIALTWVRQTRTLVRGRLEWIAAGLGTVALCVSHTPATYALLLGSAFSAGWLIQPAPQHQLRVALASRDRCLLAVLGTLILMFAMPLPQPYALKLLWIRVAGAALTLFGGGFSALPVLKSLFVSPAIGITDNDFTLAFSLSALSPGPLLNVIPFLGYLVNRWPGALIATLASFVPSGCLIVLAQRHLPQCEAHPRFERGMRVLRAVTTAFLALAVLKIARRVPLQPDYLATLLFSLLCFARQKVPVGAVYGTVAFAWITWLAIQRLH